MAYLGRAVDSGAISNIQNLDNITFDGSSSYSLTKNSVAFVPSSASNLLISIDGVVNATNFTVNNSTIDFGVTVPSSSVCNFIIHLGVGIVTAPSDGSVTTAKLGDNAVTTAKITDANVTSAKMFSGFANGITMADQWRLTSSFNFGTSGSDITSNLERIDNTGQGTLGTGMTESSGIFSFPQTGIYRVEANLNFVPLNNSSWIYGIIKATTDNSTYTNLAGVYHGQISGYYISSHNATLVDVTDNSNVKVKFHLDTQAGTITLLGSTSLNHSYFSFTRLGDT
jgi:hypothetical protein